MDPRFSLSSEQIQSAGPLPALPNDKRKDSVPIDSVIRKDTLVPCNAALTTLADALKDEILLLGENMGSLSIWIQLNVPRMQDNSSFSSEVQMQLLEQIKAAESVSDAVLDQFATYYVTRGELLTKLLKSPGLEDFRRAMVEVDEKMYMKTAMVAADIRSLYLLLFDLLSKNLSALLEAPTSGENKEVTSKMYY
jgi:proteasome activator subunit 3 (PA28 gamma)